MVLQYILQQFCTPENDSLHEVLEATKLVWQVASIGLKNRWPLVVRDCRIAILSLSYELIILLHADFNGFAIHSTTILHTGK